jgi:superfamily I DNA/RNA helicase
MGLNSQQQRAVETVDGRVLILAGAGSGKTRVLTHRIAHLIKNRHVSPKAILGLTFTNKAANEMRHRMATLVESSIAKEVTLLTFHSFCLRVLRSDISSLGYTPQFTLYDEHDVKRVLNNIARDIVHSENEIPGYADALILINKAKSKGIPPEQIVDESSKWHQEFTQTLYSRFLQAMRAYNAVDFDQLLLLCVELFEKHPDVLERYQERFRYIMIDEYQDTNPVQYRLAALLAAKYNNLCVVGDDDQSIYGWRGADMRNILDFDNATRIMLEQNYRSTNVILRAANSVIGNNKTRHQKVLWSDCGEGEQIEFFVAPNEIEEAQSVVARIINMRTTHNLEWKDMAILYRSNALSRQMEAALMKASWRDGDRWQMGVPYQIHGGVEFYERREVKDLLAYLRVIVNPMDQEAMLRIINQPRRGIGEGGLDALTAYNRSQKQPLWEAILKVCSGDGEVSSVIDKFSSRALKGLKEFRSIIIEAQERFSTPPLEASLRWLIERINYAKAICDEVKSQQMQDFKKENVAEFVSALAEYELQASQNSEEAPNLSDFIINIPLDGNHNFQRNQQKEQEDKVHLMTFHSSKGLEFPACFLIAVEDQIIPHQRSIDEGNGIEEERRLMYVAITRAMRFLTMSAAASRTSMGRTMRTKPSRFLEEVPKELWHRTFWKV